MSVRDNAKSNRMQKTARPVAWKGRGGAIPTIPSDHEIFGLGEACPHGFFGASNFCNTQSIGMVCPGSATHRQ